MFIFKKKLAFLSLICITQNEEMMFKAYGKKEQNIYFVINDWQVLTYEDYTTLLFRKPQLSSLSSDQKHHTKAKSYSYEKNKGRIEKKHEHTKHKLTRT